MIKNLPDDCKYSGFVSPFLCKDLFEIGVTVQCAFQWKIYTDSILLVTNIFDVDDYNKQATANRDAVVPPDLVMPAFTIIDMQYLVTDYKLYSIDKKFKLICDRYLSKQLVTEDERMPDVFAKMAKLHLLDDLIDLPTANNLIAYMHK